MPKGFDFWGPGHIAILCAVPLLAAILAVIQRRLPAGCRWLRFGLAGVLLAGTLLWYGYLAASGQSPFPDRLPLELCDVSLFLTLIVLLTLSPAVFDLTYYCALAGTSMALLTPNVDKPLSSLDTIQFFFFHGLVVSAVLFLMWSGQARPRAGSVGRAMLAINVLALFDGLFDAVFKTDYMFLRAKPQNASLLNLLGPWPWYIAASELVALGLFLLLYLPFRRSSLRISYPSTSAHEIGSRKD